MGISAQKHPEQVKRLIGYMPDYFGVYNDLLVWEYLDFFAAAYKIPRYGNALQTLRVNALGTAVVLMGLLTLAAI